MLAVLMELQMDTLMVKMMVGAMGLYLALMMAPKKGYLMAHMMADPMGIHLALKKGSHWEVTKAYLME